MLVFAFSLAPARKWIKFGLHYQNKFAVFINHGLISGNFLFQKLEIQLGMLCILTRIVPETKYSRSDPN
jgi:hypothetical protein